MLREKCKTSILIRNVSGQCLWLIGSALNVWFSLKENQAIKLSNTTGDTNFTEKCSLAFSGFQLSKYITVK